MRSEDGLKTVCTSGARSSMKIVREFHVPEETKSNVEVELAISLTTVNEEINGENGFSIRRYIARCDEGECGVGGDGVFDTIEA